MHALIQECGREQTFRNRFRDQTSLHDIQTVAPGVAFRHVVHDERGRNQNCSSGHHLHFQNVLCLDVSCVLQPVVRVVSNYELNGAKAIRKHEDRDTLGQRKGERPTSGHDNRSVRAQ